LYRQFHFVDAKCEDPDMAPYFFFGFKQTSATVGRAIEKAIANALHNKKKCFGDVAKFIIRSLVTTKPPTVALFNILKEFVDELHSALMEPVGYTQLYNEPILNKPIPYMVSRVLVPEIQEILLKIVAF